MKMLVNMHSYLKGGSEGFSIENSGSLDTPINEAILDDFDNDWDDDPVFSIFEYGTILGEKQWYRRI